MFRELAVYRQLARSLADNAALRLANGQLRTDVNRRLADETRVHARLRLLSMLAREFAAAAPDGRALLDLVARRMGEVVGEKVSIRVAGEDESEWLGLMGEPVLIPVLEPAVSALALPEWLATFVGELGAGSVLAVPLRAVDRVIGAVIVGRSNIEAPFTPEDLRLVEEIASHAALAIASSRLLEASQRESAERKRAEAALLHVEEQLRQARLEIQKATERAAELTRQLEVGGREPVNAPPPIDLNEVVRAFSTMLTGVIGTYIEVKNDLAPGLAMVRADRAQLEQVLLNLVVNARDAMPHGGLLNVQTFSATLDADYARRHAGVVPGAYVGLSVSDSGVGMDAVTIAQILEPALASQAGAQASSFGLANVVKIVRRSGGHVRVRSDVLRGTRVEIYLPHAG